MLRVYFCILFLVCVHAESQTAPKTSPEEIKKTVKKASAIQIGTELKLENVKFAVFDKDLSQPKEYTTLKVDEKLNKEFNLDSKKKVHLKFSIKDKNSDSEHIVQQAFVALIHTTTKQEIIYVAEPEKNSKDVKSHVKDFAGVSGKYSLFLIIGDNLASNSFNWHFADVVLTVNKVEPVVIPKSKRISYNILPEITHRFREQEPRPPKTVSLAFALICAAPILVLFIMWALIGINFGNAQLSLWALGFHLCLGLIFGLYVMYWLKLNMFQTLQYLAVIGAATFVFGNRLLNNFAQTKRLR